MKTQTTIRVEETNYHKAKQILDKMGMSYSQAIGVFNSMVVLNKGLPFEVKIPSDDTKRALKELENKKGKTFSSVEELFEDLDN
jgi:DNA-damage-inducible protein J